jgi:hypothetical protein
VAAAAASVAAEPILSPPANKTPTADYADPKATFRTYIEATRNNDVEAAKQCWVIDDDNIGALDTMVGLCISVRHLKQVTERKFGPKGLAAIPENWRGDDFSDAAMDLTAKRLSDTEVNITGDTAQLKIKWNKDDGYPNPAFFFGTTIYFRKGGGKWKIDANRMIGLEHGVDFFDESTWGHIFRDQVAIINDAAQKVNNGKLKTTKELATFIDESIKLMTKKYEEEPNRGNPKGK